MADVSQMRWTESKALSNCELFCVCGLAVLLMAASSLGCKSSSQASAGAGKGSRASQVKAVLHLEPFVVNLADAEDNRFLRVGIDLGVENPPASKENDINPNPRLRDTILAVLSSWRSDALLAPEGKEKLKDELIRSLRDRVPELGVREVYFTEFLVQR